MDKIKLGFVGAGFMGQVAHLQNYHVLDDCEVVAIAEPREKLAQKVASQYGIKKIFKSHLDLLEGADVDAIVAAQPFNRHLMIIPDILNKGIPVFTEKPLAASVEAAEKLVKLAEKNDVIHMVGYHKRSDPAMEYAQKLIREWKESGEFGQMRYVRITMPPGDWISGAAAIHLSTDESYPKGEVEAIPSYYDEETYKKYTSFVNYYIHQLNALRFMLDEPYKLVFADASEAVIVTESASGVCGTLEMAPYQTSVDWEESVFVGFENGYIKVDLPAPLAAQQPGRVTVMKSNQAEKAQGTFTPVLSNVAAMRNQASNFLKVLRGGKSAPCNSAEALEDLKIANDYIELLR